MLTTMVRDTILAALGMRKKMTEKNYTYALRMPVPYGFLQQKTPGSEIHKKRAKHLESLLKDIPTAEGIQRVSGI